MKSVAGGRAFGGTLLQSCDKFRGILGVRVVRAERRERGGVGLPSERRGSRGVGELVGMEERHVVECGPCE